MKRISTLSGILIILAVAIVLFGGVFAWQKYAKTQIPVANDQSNSNSSIDKICPGSFTAPLQNQTIAQGSKYNVVWKLPDGFIYYEVDLLLLDQNNNIVGRVYPGNWVKYNDMSSWLWDTRYVTQYAGEFSAYPDNQVEVSPGLYKLRFKYHYMGSAKCPRGEFESQEFKIEK